jgi:hypothetical protein
MINKITRIFSAAAISLLVLGAGNIIPVMADGGVSVSVKAPAEIAPDSSFTATVDITGVVDLNAAQYDILFNPSVLQLDEVAYGQIGSKTVVAMTNEVEAGHWIVVQYPIIMTDTVSGSGQLAVLHFRHIGSPGDSSDLNITDGILSGMAGEIPATWTKSSVKVISAESDGQTSSPETAETTHPPVISSPSLPPPEPEPVTVPGTTAEEPAPALLLPPAPESGKVAEIAPDAAVAEPEPAEMPPLPPEPQSRPVNWPLLWCVISGIFTIVILFFIFRPGRGRY